MVPRQDGTAVNGRPPGTPSPALLQRSLAPALILAIAPFIVRRILLLGDDNYVHWMAIDYLARCISLVGVILGFRSGLLPSSLPRADWSRSFQVFLLLFAAQLIQQAFGYPFLQHYFRFWETLMWPHIAYPPLQMADLTIGLLFAVFVEELVFRKFLFAVIKRRFADPAPVILFSAAAFALIHFTSGVVDTMLNAFVHGVLLGLAYWTTRRLSVCVLSHYLVDFFIFCGH